MTALPQPLLLVGGGKMGTALLVGWLARGLEPAAAHVVEPDAARRSELLGLAPIQLHAEPPADLAPAAIVFAVKPQVLDAVLPAYRNLAAAAGLLLSIVAGKPIAVFERVFGAGRAIVRAMPNTPAAVGRGVTVLCANGAVDAAGRDQARALMEAVGSVYWIEDEDLMHAVTAVSGSGPAYVFLLVEAMARAGIRLGLPGELASRLARETVSGSGELLARSPEEPASLRQAVTSPGGTTEAALRVLMAENGLPALLEAAIAAAERRSRELGDS